MKDPRTGDHTVVAETARLGFKEFPATVEAHATVRAMREMAVSRDPSHAEELDHLIGQFRDQSDVYLRAIASDPQKTCEGLGIQVGDVSWATVAALAQGELQDRAIASDRGFQWWHLVLTSLLTLLGALVLYVLTKGQG